MKLSFALTPWDFVKDLLAVVKISNSQQDSVTGESIQKSFCLQVLISAACFSNVQFPLSDLNIL